MSFNSFTYHANKYRRQAWMALADARLEKKRGLIECAESSVKLARCYMKLSLSNRRQRQMQKEHGW